MLRIEAASYVELLETVYSTHLKECAKWIADEVRLRTLAGFKTFIRQELGDWTEAFSAYGSGATERR